VETLRELFDPAAVWHTPGRSLVAGDHSGIDAILAFFGQATSSLTVQSGTKGGDNERERPERKSIGGGLEPGTGFVVLDADAGPDRAWRDRWPSLRFGAALWVPESRS
jgi:hypothetical protein